MSACLRKSGVLIIILGINIAFGSIFGAEAATQIPLSGTSWSVGGSASLEL